MLSNVNHRSLGARAEMVLSLNEHVIKTNKINDFKKKIIHVVVGKMVTTSQSVLAPTLHLKLFHCHDNHCTSAVYQGVILTFFAHPPLWLVVSQRY